MFTSKSDNSSEDEDSIVVEISQKMESFKVDGNQIAKSSCNKPSEEQTKNRSFFYYPAYDPVEYAQTHNKNMPLCDPFIKELTAVLKKFPSITGNPTEDSKQSDNTLRRRNISTFKTKTSRFHEENTERDIKPGNLFLKNELKTLNANLAKFPSSLKPKVSRDMSAKVSESCMSEISKIKYVNLIKMLCKSDDTDFPSSFLNYKQEFLELLAQIDTVQDVIPQTIEVILKIFRIDHPSRQNILVSLTHDEFIQKLVSYISLLPTQCEENLSDSEIEKFFHNILLFCENMNSSSLSKSTRVLRKIMVSLQYSIRGLNEVRLLNVDVTLENKIGELLESSRFQRSSETKKKKYEENESLIEPPDDIKDIEIFPTKKDLFEPPTFLRKNVVDGSYRDVNHYIDVQFRLLREDFIAPLRSGLQLYCESVARGEQDKNRCFDNVRIHKDVKILHGTITYGRLGHLVKLRNSEGLYNSSKTFMFGSLLLFTADDFNSFFCGTVIHPVEENLLIVELCVDEISLSDVYNNSYTMIESKVYFEPYFHALTALKKLDCETFPMKEYIVDVKFIRKETESKVDKNCPLILNESQKQAFSSAMSNDFVVIQGPPGTGKTFLAEVFTKALLLSKKKIFMSSKTLIGIYDEIEKERFRALKRGLQSNKHKDQCVYRSYPREWKLFHVFFCELERDDKPILVVCYTNHALDQFLERLLSLTKRVIRIGGQSKNSEVKNFSLKEIRRSWIKEHTFNPRRCNCSSCRLRTGKYSRYFECREIVQDYTYEYLVCLKILKTIVFDGVLKIDFLLQWMSSSFHQVLFMQKQFEAWLLEGAYVLPIEDKDDDDNNEPDVTIHTQQLISEIREPSTYWDDLEMFDDLPTVESRSTAEADEKFFVKCSELLSQREAIQKKLRKCRKKGRNEKKIHFYETQIEDLDKKRRYISYMFAHKTPVDLRRIRELNKTVNIWAMDFEDRWMLYNYWVQQYESYVKNNMVSIENLLQLQQKRFIEMREEFDHHLLKSANVIGMTTTSAARLRNTMEIVKPEIVVVEEAAEVLEAYVVASLTPGVKKLILIGDHKQLKPNPAVYELAQQYKLDVSLFERMINNGVACHVLDTQQRMRPEIASLIAPAIYPDLKNGERVLNRPDIRGVAANVFFVTHNKFEDKSFGEDRSHSNTHEVNFLVSLCKYLLQQDYRPSEITILATYLGQMTALENERRSKHLPAKLRISTVDNYQGEESDIILLSLVRSNPDAIIGFLSAENRVCVALSRAKCGLYIIGNMDSLTQSSTIWRQVKAQLEAMNAIGPALPLGCKNHQDGKSLVSCSNDFGSVPISGCKLKCGAKLQCGHICSEDCHSVDPEHKSKFACPLPCERMACEEHRCTKTCGEECTDCQVVVEKQLPCRHSVQLKCSADPKFHLCKEMVTLTLENCGHSAQISCSEDPNFYLCKKEYTITLNTCGHTVTKFCHEKSVCCVEPCTDILPCGHPCKRLCHAHSSLHFLMKKIDYHTKEYCFEEIEKCLDCGHICKIECCYSNKTICCQEPCSKTLPCEHPCDNLCGNPCTETCNVLVEKTLSPCGHKLMLGCSTAAESSRCRQPCQLSLPCGHRCTGTCSADCSRFTCVEKVCCTVEPACGHGLITIPCHLNTTDLRANSDQLLQHCRSPCRADLACGHVCVGNCGDCLQGRLHIPCSFPCTRLLRCGHSCQRDCRSECPTVCDRPCMYKCPHQQCPQLCGDPCTPCQKRCERRCRHQECSRNCSEDCDCPPCQEPCPLLLRCGHSCPGFCGEPCIKYCAVCAPDAFVVSDHKLDPRGSRYVSLEDCGHPIEENLLRKLIVADKKPNGVKKCPICDKPIQFSLRFKDNIIECYSQIAITKAEENMKIENFERKMKTEKYNLKYYVESRLVTYGDYAIFIWEKIMTSPLVYKTSLWVFTFFKQLTEPDRFILKKNGSWDIILERRKLLLRALFHRLESMSSTDYNEILTEIFRLEIATNNWETRSDLLLSLKKYTLDELKALK